MDCWTISVTQNMRAPIRRIFRLRLMDGRVYFWFGGAFFLSFSCPAHQLGDKKKERKKKKLQIPASWKPWKRSWVHAWWGGTCWRSAHSWWPSICIFRLGPFLTGCKREEKKEDDKYTDVGPTRPSARKSVSGSDDLRKMNGLKLKKGKISFFPYTRLWSVSKLPAASHLHATNEAHPPSRANRISANGIPTPPEKNIKVRICFDCYPICIFFLFGEFPNFYTTTTTTTTLLEGLNESGESCRLSRCFHQQTIAHNNIKNIYV